LACKVPDAKGRALGPGVPESEETGVSRQSFSVAYSGADRRDDRAMDVETLAPALLAVGRLIRLANLEFNGDRAYVNVNVLSDFEHRCFNINFETIITGLDHAKTMLGLTGDNIKAAKDILEQVGLLKPAAAGVSLYAYLRYRKGRKI
jgi:hypothetical protein